MKLSIVIPTLNNLDYLKILIQSIEKNSSYNHEIIVHVSENKDNTIDYLESKKIKYSFSNNNVGLCTGVNKASKLITTDFIMYIHDDMYLLPEWDLILEKEIKKIDTQLFYLSATMIQKSGADLQLDCGDNHLNFNEKFLLDNYKSINLFDHQGTHWAPHIIHKSLWEKVGGFSEEFNPGDGSDSDLNMKLWLKGVRLFKGLNDFKVYHFGSISMRKKIDLKKNNGTKIFLKKWGITPKFFFKYYLKTGTKFDGLLPEPQKNLFYFLEYFICKIKRIFI
tara:strand:- start:1422 stop:2258 length:837 start_codon:yes stop_codon:yes gene_type:complete